jgi:hypothetical protein
MLRPHLHGQNLMASWTPACAGEHGAMFCVVRWIAASLTLLAMTINQMASGSNKIPLLWRYPQCRIGITNQAIVTLD